MNLQNKTAMVRPSLTIFSNSSSSMSSISSFSKWLNSQWRISSSSIKSPSYLFGSCFSKKMIVGSWRGERIFRNAIWFEEFSSHIFDTMFLSSTFVVNLHKLNSMLITVVVNLLQLFNDLKRIVIVFAVCKDAKSQFSDFNFNASSTHRKQPPSCRCFGSMFPMSSLTLPQSRPRHRQSICFQWAIQEHLLLVTAHLPWQGKHVIIETTR